MIIICYEPEPNCTCPLFTRVWDGKMTKLTAYGGTNEIGGNKILLQDGDTKIFLDFGVSFGAEAEYFGGAISPRKVNGIGDYLEFGILPRLEGLYAQDEIKQTGIPSRSPEYQAIIVSHAHADHVGYVKFLDKAIPVYCGETSKIILTAQSESGSSDLNPSFLRCFRTGDSIKTDNVETKPIHVDHSIPGAYGFIIHTSEGTIVYTGDLRLHGPAAKMTEEFVEKAAEEHPLILICEGTRVGQKDQHKLGSEAEVKEAANKVVSTASGLVVASFYGRDMDRLNTFNSVAMSNDREFVISMKTALLLTKLQEDKHLKVPDVLHDENILVYKKRKKTGAYQEKDYFKWERPYLDKAVDHKYIHDHQSKVLMAIEPSNFTELIDIRPDAEGDYIYSMSEPHSELEEVDEEIQANWLKHYGMELHQIHASGHAPQDDIAKIIERIKPKILVPVHTEFQDKFIHLLKKESPRILILEKSKTVPLP
jgi:ribonuclease J